MGLAAPGLAEMGVVATDVVVIPLGRAMAVGRAMAAGRATAAARAMALGLAMAAAPATALAMRVGWAAAERAEWLSWPK